MNSKNAGEGEMLSNESIGVHSGQVMTVLGPVPVEEIGITLTHEHILCDTGCIRGEPAEASRKALYHKPVDISILGEIRLDPHSNRDNQMIIDVDLLSDEVAKFGHWGGKTIVEVTNEGIGRDPLGLQQVSRRSGVQIIMGSGYYIDASLPSEMSSRSAENIADEIVRDITEGVPGTGVRAGIIGEVAIDLEFTAEEEKSLRGAALASKRTQVPLSIHLPGRIPPDYVPRVLDIVEKEGADLRHMILCHVQLHSRDLEIQKKIADRGVFLGYDGISCDFDWGIRGIGPCDEENAADIKRLIDDGYLHYILPSHDVHNKIMLTRYGGHGYAYMLRRFVGRLQAHGVTDAQIETMLVENPKRLFSSKYRDAE
ncbi:MAG: phosphotriesterase-related protein [Spirochaetota bacterium]|nr:MAG: phosphotriesterase-related protein [Spirochaetota bacterium]